MGCKLVHDTSSDFLFHSYCVFSNHFIRDTYDLMHIVNVSRGTVRMSREKDN